METVANATPVAEVKKIKLDDIALVAKVSDSGKSMLVGVKRSVLSIGYDTFAWCANPQGAFTKGQFLPKVLADALLGATTVQATNDTQEPLFHDDKTPVLRWVF